MPQLRKILQKPNFEVPSVKDITNQGGIMSKKFITNATHAEVSGDLTTEFSDGTNEVKLGVSDEDYKAFEATFAQDSTAKVEGDDHALDDEAWKKASLAFYENELSKYPVKEPEA